MKTIGEKIKELRKTKGASQEDLAFELGVSRQTIHKWECNATQPSADNLKALCDYFKISSDYFINGNVAIEETVVSCDVTAIEKVAIVNDGQKLKSKKYFIMSIIAIIVISLALIVSISFTAGTGCIIFSYNIGHDYLSILEVHKYTFYLFLILSIALLALDVIMIVFIKKR